MASRSVHPFCKAHRSAHRTQTTERATCVAVGRIYAMRSKNPVTSELLGAWVAFTTVMDEAELSIDRRSVCQVHYCSDGSDARGDNGLVIPPVRCLSLSEDCWRQACCCCCVCPVIRSVAGACFVRDGNGNIVCRFCEILLGY